MKYTNDLFDPDSLEIKVIRVFLLAFVLLLCYQSVQFMNTRRIDRKHSELLVAKNQTVKTFEDLLIQSSTIQRKLLNLALTEDEREKQELHEIIDKSAIGCNNAIKALEEESVKFNPDRNLSLENLKAAYARYFQTFTLFEQYINNGRRDEAIDLKNTSLRPEYENFILIQQQFLMKVTDDIVVQSNKLSNYTSISSWILFIFGLIPFIYAITKLLYLSIILKLKSSRVSLHDENSRFKT